MESRGGGGREPEGSESGRKTTKRGGKQLEGIDGVRDAPKNICKEKRMRRTKWRKRMMRSKPVLWPSSMQLIICLHRGPSLSKHAARDLVETQLGHQVTGD